MLFPSFTFAARFKLYLWNFENRILELFNQNQFYL